MSQEKNVKEKKLKIEKQDNNVEAINIGITNGFPTKLPSLEQTLIALQIPSLNHPSPQRNYQSSSSFYGYSLPIYPMIYAPNLTHQINIPVQQQYFITPNICNGNGSTTF